MGKAKRKLKFFFSDRLRRRFRFGGGADEKTFSLLLPIASPPGKQGREEEDCENEIWGNGALSSFPHHTLTGEPQITCSVIILLLRTTHARTLAQRNKKTRCFLLHSIPATLHHKKSGPPTHKLSAVLALLCLPGARPKNARRVTGNGPRPLPS